MRIFFVKGGKDGVSKQILEKLETETGRRSDRGLKEISAGEENQSKIIALHRIYKGKIWT